MRRLTALAWLAAAGAIALPAVVSAAGAVQPSDSTIETREGWPLLPIAEVRARNGAAPLSAAALVAQFRTACVGSGFDAARIGTAMGLASDPASTRAPGGGAKQMNRWLGSDRTAQFIVVDDFGMGRQCTLTIATARPVSDRAITAAMAAAFGQARNYRADQADFRDERGRFAPDWLGYRAHWLAEGGPGALPVVVFARTWGGPAGQGVHLVAAELLQ